jgi:hypothetical protein
MTPDKPVITTQGLNDIGVTLNLAYPGRSWQEVVLANTSEHHIIAALVLYEFTKQDGTKGFARDVICDPHVSLEESPLKIKALLTKYSVIPPNSTWLCGVGLDRLRIGSEVPPFEKVQEDLVFQRIVLTPPALTRLDITIDGVITENGHTIGPQKENLRRWVIQIINANKGPQ